MGNTSPRASRSSKQQTTTQILKENNNQELRQIARRIDEKENICIAMQKDIDAAILQGKINDIELLKNEINANLIDLNQIFKIKNIPRGHLTKAVMVKHNFETNLARLKSLELLQEKNSNNTENSSTGNPDLVKDLIGLDVEPSCLVGLENKLEAVSDELAVLQDNFARSLSDYDTYCILDKGIFYLKADLKNIDIPTSYPLHQRKLDLIEELSAFQDSVTCRFAEIQEQQNFITEVDSLFLKLSEATVQYDLDLIHNRVLALREQLPTSTWGTGLSLSKETVLMKLAEIERSTIILRKKCSEKRDSQKHTELDIEKLNIMPTIDRIDFKTDNSGTDVDESLYGNFDVIRHHRTDADEALQNIQTVILAQNNLDLPLPRSTIYVNAEVIKDMDYNPLGKRPNETEMEIKKRPLPLPRNTEDTVINNLPRYWQNLNEILLADSSDETSRNEVAYIQKQIEFAKSLFEEKMKLVLKKFEETDEF